MLTAALFATALCLPVTAAIWQFGHLRRRQLWHQSQQEARKQDMAAEQKRWEDAVASVDVKLKPALEQLGKLETRLARIEENRKVLELTRVGT